MENVAIGSSAAVFVIRAGLKHCDSAAQCMAVNLLMTSVVNGMASVAYQNLYFGVLPKVAWQ